MDNGPSTSDSGGLLNVGRRSIRRLAHAVKRKRGAVTEESADAPAAKAPTRNTSSDGKFSERKSSFRWKKSESKKHALPGAAAKQQQATEPAEKGSGQRGASAQRKNRGRRPSVRGTNKTRSTPLMSWPFKRSHGKLDIQNLLSQDGRASRGKAKRSTRVKTEAKINAAVKSETSELSRRSTREEGTLSDNGGQRVLWKDAGGEGDDGAQRRAKKRRRRRRSQSDAELFHRTKATKQTHVVTTGLCTPKRPRREEQTRRCKPKKLAVTKEEFLSLKKKLEWELTFNLYCRQKREFMEINKDMYDCDDCDARA